MKAKCRLNLVVADKIICSVGQVVDVEPFEASWYENKQYRAMYAIHHPPCVEGAGVSKVTARGYGFKNEWVEVKMYEGVKAANHFNGIDFNKYFEIVSEELMLTADNVEAMHELCLSNAENLGSFLVEGVKNAYWYDKRKIERHTKGIIEMLMQLPKTFRKSSGGGWSFLQMCMREDGIQWTGLHVTVEKLMCLGIACGKMEYLLSKDMWKVLPAEMPYLVIKDK